MRFTTTHALLIVLAVLLTIGCASTTYPTPTVAGVTVTPATSSGAAARGEVLFKNTCAPCHSGQGIAPHDLADLPSERIRQTVRQGKDGVMPQFSESELSDQDLNDIIAYLKSGDSTSTEQHPAE